MEVIHPRCAGLDVHKKTVVACAITPDANGKWRKEIVTFTTMTGELLKLSDWLLACDGGFRTGDAQRHCRW